jgi:hypothetical protein
MAGYRAIGAVCEAVVQMLARAWQPDVFDAEAQFKVFRSRDFVAPMETGASLFLYRAAPNGTHRTQPQPAHRRRPLPIDLSFVLTPWAKEASLEQEILTWLLRTMADSAVLSSGLLNTATPGVFSANERVEVVPADVANEELFRLWDVLPGDFQLSVPYAARVVRIDGAEIADAGPVLTRNLDYGVLKRA